MTTEGNNSTTEHSFTIDFAPKPISCITYSPTNLAPSASTSQSQTQPSLIFTHGATGTLSSLAIVHFTAGYTAAGGIVCCYHGSSNLVNRKRAFVEVYDHLETIGGGDEVGVGCLGGRSMGARAAIIASKERAAVSRLVLVSFPMENLGEDRSELLTRGIPEGMEVLFVVGTRDKMCPIPKLRVVVEEMEKKGVKVWMVVVEDGDHGLGVHKNGTQAVGEMVGEVVRRWVARAAGEDAGEGGSENYVWWDTNSGEDEGQERGPRAVEGGWGMLRWEDVRGDVKSKVKKVKTVKNEETKAKPAKKEKNEKDEMVADQDNYDEKEDRKISKSKLKTKKQQVDLRSDAGAEEKEREGAARRSKRLKALDPNDNA